MALYNEIGKRNIVKMCDDLLKSKVLVQRDSDGKLELSPVTAAWEVPWHHVGDGEINCHLWNTIMFQNIFQKLPYYFTGGKQYVPSGCMDCFKVVVRPPNLKALFALVELMEKMGRNCKAGVEHRPFVFGLYGGYFYNRGLEEGLECYKEVRQAVDEAIGIDVKVILKRACTEMEMKVGPSDKWEMTPEQVEIERLVYSHLNCDLVRRRQSRMAIDYVHSRWIEFAYQWGDETVFNYLDPDKPIYKPLVTYHHIAEGGGDMTMRIVYLKTHDGHEIGKDYRVERSLGARLCENKIAIPYSVHIDNLRLQEEQKAKAEAKAKEEKEKARLLKEKEEMAKETAELKSARTRSKSSKKGD